jgi:hypothetical protein
LWSWLCAGAGGILGPYDGEGIELVAEIADLEGKRVVGAHLVVVLELDGIGEVRQRELVLAGAVAVHEDELTTGLWCDKARLVAFAPRPERAGRGRTSEALVRLRRAMAAGRGPTVISSVMTTLSRLWGLAWKLLMADAST